MPPSRFFSAAAAAAALALLMAGCADAGAPATSTSIARPSGPLNVYAAASLREGFDDIVAAFETEHPAVDVSVVYDGSSTLVTQILEGAPADVFASADEATMDRAAAVVLAPQLFATNTPVIAVPAGNPGGVRTLADLARVTTVLCAPEVPCGAASEALLDDAGATVSPVSLEQNVTAVLTKVAAGEADAGIVYATDVKAAAGVESIVPDGADEVVNRYPVAALADAANPAAAAAFVAFVLSEAGREILAGAGFGAP